MIREQGIFSFVSTVTWMLFWKTCLLFPIIHLVSPTLGYSDLRAPVLPRFFENLFPLLISTTSLSVDWNLGLDSPGMFLNQNVFPNGLFLCFICGLFYLIFITGA